MNFKEISEILEQSYEYDLMMKVKNDFLLKRGSISFEEAKKVQEEANKKAEEALLEYHQKIFIQKMSEFKRRDEEIKKTHDKQKQEKIKNLPLSVRLFSCNNSHMLRKKITHFNIIQRK